MAQRAKRGFWRTLRIGFRWCRITVLLAILAALCGLIYLDEVGLPDFVKVRLVDTLRQRGLDLQFTRLRLQAFHRIVADNVRFGKPDQPGGPQLSAREAELSLDLHELVRLRLLVEGVRLRQGTFEWPLGQSNGPPRSLKVEDIETTVSFLPGDKWSLDDFRAKFASAQFALSAMISNASAIRNWKFLHGRRPANAEKLAEQLRHFSDILQKISFLEPPDIRLMVQGDAKDLQTFSAFLTVNAPDVNTPWGVASRLVLATRLRPATTNAVSRADLRLEAGSVHTPWGGGRDIQFTAGISAPPDLPPADASWSWWTNLQPFCADWKLSASSPRYEGRLDADKLAVAGWWRAPGLEVTNLYVQWPEGAVRAGARLDVATREAHFFATSDFDPRRIEPLLTEKPRVWMDRFDWATVPYINGSGSIRLAAWTDRRPDWRGEVIPTLQLAGEVTATNGSYMRIPADWVRTHFTYTNMIWHLPDLDVGRPEGRLHIMYTVSDRTQDYYWHVRGTMDPLAVRPLLATNAQRGLDLFTFTMPPAFDAELWGQNHRPDLLRGHAHVTLTNFTFRGETAGYFETELQYTNRFMRFINPQLWRSGQVLTAACVAVDIPSRRVYFTNGFSTTDPMAVARAIGPVTARAIEPYHFDKPPSVYVEGYTSLNDVEDTDMRFAITGGPFEWWRFKVPYIKGVAHWMGGTLVLTNIQGAFYGGECHGAARFDFDADEGTDFSFNMNARDADFKSLMTDLVRRPNHLEGRLSGAVVITNANSQDIHSCQGFGHASLHDGLIWDIPIFGILSPILNSIVPGLGTSRASEASAQFVITNGVVSTDDLEIRAPVMRMQYTGTVDLDGRLNARVDAEPLRDMMFLGRVVGMVLTPVTKLMEYKITGTLSKPKAYPVYIPKFLFLPLHPFRTMEDLFNGNSDNDDMLPGFVPEGK